MGSDLKPLERGLYDILEVDPTATPLEIKKAYRRLATKHHPDKNLDNLDSEEVFKGISKAYQILSDTQSRCLYNKFGESAFAPGGGENPEMAAAAAIISDPHEFFRSQFGGEGFIDIIGDISIAKDFGQAVSQAAGQESATETVNAANNMTESTPEEDEQRKEDHEKRVAKLVEKLNDKLGIYSTAFPLVDEEAVDNGQEELPKAYAEQKAGALEKFTAKIVKEVEELRKEPFGAELLHAVGYTYRSKSNQHQAKLDAESPFVGRRITGFFGKLGSSLRERTHVFSETFGTIKTAYDLQSSFSKLQELEEVRKEKETGISPAEKESKSKKKLRDLTMEQEEELIKTLETEAASKGMQALWRGSKLEIESVVREVCDIVLADINASRESRRRRCVALETIAELYQSAKPVETHEETVQKQTKQESDVPGSFT